MRSMNTVLLAAALGFTLGSAGCSKSGESTSTPETAAPEQAKTPLEIARDKASAYEALPANFDSKTNPWSKEKETLGRMLYYENRLSMAKDISCNSCHQLDKFGVDGEPTSPGFNHQRGTRNSPTVYNAAGHIAQFWDGRAPDVEEQAKGPVLNPVEMAMPAAPEVVARLKAIPGYVEAFKKAFPGEDDPVSYDNMAKAIGVFERRLTTPSRWDQFLGGKDDALTPEEIKGFVTFAEVGCMSCHNGALVGGNSYQKLGAVKAWPDLKDNGREDATKKPEDKYFFKVPSLRNVAKTGPYFHDGKVAKLDEAVTMMARHQLGVELKPEQVASIITWLEALTGEVPTDYIAKPELPPEVAAADTPTGDEPAADAPAADAPTGDEPAADAPAADAPTGDEPAADEPAADEPAADEPAADEPAAPSDDDKAGE